MQLSLGHLTRALVMLQVVDEIESSTGAPLDPSNQDGWSQLQTRVEVQFLSPMVLFTLRVCSLAGGPC